MERFFEYITLSHFAQSAILILMMNVFFILLALPVVTLCYTVDQRLIYVDSSQTGVNDSSCWEGGYSTPCLSLNLALKGAQHNNHSITILLQPGQHQLHSGSETQLRNMSQLAIVGNGGEGEVVIKCQLLAGLSFLQSNNITMKNLKIISCGALQNSVSKHTRNVFLRMQSAIFCSTCNMYNSSMFTLLNPMVLVLSFITH